MTILTVIIFSSILFSQDYPELGSSESLDFMTWNVQNYQKHNQTNSYMEDIISQIGTKISCLLDSSNTPLPLCISEFPPAA